MNTYDPEIWLESLTRTIKDYTHQGFTKSILDDQNNPVGDQAYEIVMEFPGPYFDTLRNVPLERSIVHFEIDDIQTNLVGFGDNIFAQNFDSVTGSVKPQEARRHEVNFDVGVWTTDSTGGTTARLRGYQTLVELFTGAMGTNALRKFSESDDGPIDILHFLGGRFATEKVNDIPVYRVVGAELEVRVFSRTPIQHTVEWPAILEVDIEEMTIPIPEFP